tara:strand:- start:548 stop:865 length:318 start_codon:yes stop_codon:yes gene_type:complete
MVNRSGKRRPLPPSRERYERSHPTVSLRVDLDLYAQLKALKEKANLSVADVLKVGLQKGEPLVGEAFRNGFMSALAEVYEAVCDGCEDAVMAIAIAQGAEPDSPK